MEDLQHYLNNFVEPTIAEFERNPTSVRHAFLACVVTFHSVDYLAHPKRSAPLRQKWNKSSKAFALVDHVAHAFKHVKTGNPANPDLRANEVVAQTGAFDSVFSDAIAFESGSVTLEGDPSLDILIIVKEAAEFIRAQLDLASSAASARRPTAEPR